MVSAATRENMTLICVVLHCQPMYERSAQLMNDAFETYTLAPLVQQDEKLFLYNGDKKQTGIVKENYYYPLSDGEKEQLEIITAPSSITRKDKEIIGQFQIYLSKRLLFSGNLYKL